MAKSTPTPHPGASHSEIMSRPARTDQMGSSTPKPEAPAPSSSDSFTKSMSPLARAKAEAALSKSLVNQGRAISRRSLVEEKIAAGAKIETRNGERRLMTPDGSYLAESQISKTGMDYAEHLTRTK